MNEYANELMDYEYYAETEVENNDKVVRFPMSTQKKYMKNKKCDYKTLAIMTLYSNMTPMEKQHNIGDYEPYRYIYKNKIIKFTDEIEALSKNKIGTIVNNVRKLSQLEDGLITVTKTDNEEIIYYINYENNKGREYVSIPEKILNKLIIAGNSNMIKIYLLLKYMCEHEKSKYGKDDKKITNSYLCESIGLCQTSHANFKTIKIITDSLEEFGLINKRKVRVSEEGIKEYIYYSVTSYEDWIKIQEDRERKRYERS